MDRGFLSLSSQEREGKAAENWGNHGELTQIAAELSHRSTPKAQRLERKITAHLSELTPTRAGGRETQNKGVKLRAMRGDLQEVEQLLRQREEAIRTLSRELATERPLAKAIRSSRSTTESV